MLGEQIRVAGDWFYISFVENNGMAFGMEFGGEWGKLLLSVFRIIVVSVMTVYLFRMARSKDAHPGVITAFSMIVAGAIGNIIDSAFYGLIFDHSYGQVAGFLPPDGGYGTFLHGRVVDMFYFPMIESNFPEWLPFWGGEEFIFFSPVFNIADAAITSGVVLFIIFRKQFFKEEPAINKDSLPAGN